MIIPVVGCRVNLVLYLLSTGQLGTGHLGTGLLGRSQLGTGPLSPLLKHKMVLIFLLV